MSRVAATVRDSGGVFFVPALAGLGTPDWDFGARGLLAGLEAGTSHTRIVRAVLEGVAQRGRDLLESVEHDASIEIAELHIDGGMSANETFCQLLADAIERPVLVSAEREATTLGAGLLAGTAIGMWRSLEEASGLARVSRRYEPQRRLDRERWLSAKERAKGTVPALSLLKF